MRTERELLVGSIQDGTSEVNPNTRRFALGDLIELLVVHDGSCLDRLIRNGGVTRKPYQADSGATGL